MKQSREPNDPCRAPASRPGPISIPQRPASRSRFARAFTLIEIMMVVAILGIILHFARFAEGRDA